MTTASGRTTVTYLVRCALPNGRSITKQDQNGAWYTFRGAIGLGPAWETDSCDQQCQESVSACLMAHVNTAGVHIPLWLVSPSAAIGWGQNSQYPNQEGTYFGNLFAPNPSTGSIDAFYCNGPSFTKSLVPGRLGANQTGSPYTNPFGPGAACAGHCIAPDAPSQNDGYQSCLTYNTPVTVWRQNAPAFDPAKTYRVSSSFSGKCIDVLNAETYDGASVKQITYRGADQQRWYITPVGDGYYRICAKHSGKCLSVAGNSTADGADMQQWTSQNVDSQKWAISPMGDTVYAIVAKPTSKAMSVAGNSTAEGAQIHQWTYNGNSFQLWTIAQAQ
jgi:hypothetical protein